MPDQPKRPVSDTLPPGGETGVPSARDLQENASQGDLEVEPGSDADQAAEVPHVG